MVRVKSVALSVADILAKLTRKIDPVECPEIGQTLHVRSLSVGELRAVSQQSEGKDDTQGMAVTISAYTCDAEGNALFSYEEALQLCEAMDSCLVRRLLQAGHSLNFVTQKSVEKALGN